MSFTNWTPVPNVLLNDYLPTLKPVELKIVLVIIRSTLGWVKSGSNKRKERDWIAGSQLQSKTGYSKRGISSAIDRLTKGGLIEVSNGNGTVLNTPEQRKGQMRLYYRFIGDTLGKTLQPVQKVHRPMQVFPKPMQKVPYTKETTTKEIIKKHYKITDDGPNKKIIKLPISPFTNPL